MDLVLILVESQRRMFTLIISVHSLRHSSLIFDASSQFSPWNYILGNFHSACFLMRCHAVMRKISFLPFVATVNDWLCLMNSSNISRRLSLHLIGVMRLLFSRESIVPALMLLFAPNKPKRHLSITCCTFINPHEERKAELIAICFVFDNFLD